MNQKLIAALIIAAAIAAWHWLPSSEPSSPSVSVIPAETQPRLQFPEGIDCTAEAAAAEVGGNAALADFLRSACN